MNDIPIKCDLGCYFNQNNECLLDECIGEEDEIEEIPCDRCGRTFPKNAFQAYEDYDHCCWDCCCHLEDPTGYPFDPKKGFLK